MLNVNLKRGMPLPAVIIAIVITLIISASLSFLGSFLVCWLWSIAWTWKIGLGTWVAYIFFGPKSISAGK